MAADALIALRRALPSLSQAETKVATAILDNPLLVVDSTITEVAEVCGTSSATVARFCQSLGYAGYRDFRIAVASATSREEAERDRFDVHDADIHPDDPVEEVLAKLAYQEVQAIDQTVKSIDRAMLERVVDAIISANRIDIIGFGSSSLAAQDLQQKLYRIGLTANTFTDVHLALASAALLGPHGVAIGITHSGLTIETDSTLEIARRAGATTVCMTNFPDSTIAAKSELVLATQTRESRYRFGAMSSRIAQLALVDVLFVRVAQRTFGPATESLRATYEAVQGHRLSPDRRR